MGSGSSIQSEVEKPLLSGSLLRDEFFLIYNRLQTIEAEEEEFNSENLEGVVQPFLESVLKVFKKNARDIGFSIVFPGVDEQEVDELFKKADNPEISTEEYLELSLKFGEAFEELLRKDPFCDTSEDDCWNLLENEEVELITIEEESELLKIEEERVVIQCINEAANDFKITESTNSVIEKVVGIDLSNAVFENDINIGLPFIRTLTLSGCTAPNSGIPLSGMPFLQVLDLSYIDLNEVEIYFTPVMYSLRRLLLDGCGLSSVSALLRELSYLKRLRILSLTENNIESISCLPNGMCTLESLDLRDNENFGLGKSDKQLDDLAKTQFPTLKSFNNRNLSDAGVTTSYGNINGIQQAMIRTDTVADQNEDRGSCSCIEGAPCEVEYTCKDWKHRFEVAEFAKNNGKLG